MARIYPSLGALQNQVNSPNYSILNSPILHLPLQNNLNPLAGVGTVTFNRNSEATYIDRYGAISTSNIDEPRFEKNGLLIEGASTNKILYSEKLNQQPQWKYIGVLPPTQSAASSKVASPDRKWNAWQLFDTTTTSIHAIHQNVTIAASSISTASIFLKKGSSRYAQVTIGNQVADDTYSSTHYYSIYIDLQDGTVFSETINGATQYSVSVIKVLGGWYRVALTAQFASNITGLRFQVKIIKETADGFLESFNGENLNPLSLYLWGAQVETQMFPSSYVATTDLPVVRNAELLTINILNQTINYPTSQNTYMMGFDLLGTKHEVYRNIFNLGGFSYNLLRVLADGSLTAYYGGSISDGVALEANTMHRAALRYDNGTYSLFRNGFKIAYKKSSPYIDEFPNGIITIGGSGANEYILNGHITNFRIYDAALTDDEIRIL